ncbi:MAG: cytochrome C [Verrucomicrobiota bacterium]
MAKSLSYGDKTPRCPENPEFKMEKRISNFAFIGNAKEPSEEGPMDDMDDAKMDKIMAEMERDLAGFDEDNPDPKQMGHVMRKMAELTGEKLPGEMEEMVKRLEAGEDPEKLEEEYGDVMGDEDGMGDELGEGGDEGNSTAAKIRKLRRKMMGPRKDPNLYDMGKYCD